jgi:hypothetical protein
MRNRAAVDPVLPWISTSAGMAELEAAQKKSAGLFPAGAVQLYALKLKHPAAADAPRS